MQGSCLRNLWSRSTKVDKCTVTITRRVRGKDLTNDGNSRESKIMRSLPLELGWLLKEAVVSRDDERENRLGRTLADKE